MHKDLVAKGNPLMEIVNKHNEDGDSVFIRFDDLMKIISNDWYLRNLPINKRDREFLARGAFPPLHNECKFVVDLDRNEDD